MKPRIIVTTIRMPEDYATILRDQYSATYNDHRMSFNSWLLHLIAAGLETKENQPA